MMFGGGRTRKGLHYAGIAALIALLVPFMLVAAPQVAGAEHSYVVLSSSMSPTIHAGDVVVVQDVSAAQIEEGDVITFEPPSGHSEAGAERVTHRVIEVVEKDDGTYFRTKGDANEEADQALVPAENLVGSVWFHIPYVGYVVQFAGTDMGILAFVVMPAVLLAALEIRDLWQAATVNEESATEDEDAAELPEDGDDDSEPRAEQSPAKEDTVTDGGDEATTASDTIEASDRDDQLDGWEFQRVRDRDQE